MKTILFCLSSLLILISGFIHFNIEDTQTKLSPPVLPANNNITSNFLIGSLHSAVDDDNDFANVNDLGLNMWHRYLIGDFNEQLNRRVPYGWGELGGPDSLTADSSVYFKIPHYL